MPERIVIVGGVAAGASAAAKARRTNEDIEIVMVEAGPCGGSRRRSLQASPPSSGPGAARITPLLSFGGPPQPAILRQATGMDSSAGQKRVSLGLPH